MMRKMCVLVTCLSVLSVSGASGEVRLKIATTTSLYETGLLDYLLPDFAEKHNVKTDVISAGTGKALKLGENGDVDLLLIHAPDAEEEFVKNGFGINRKTIMYNDFIIIGPADDPAGIKKADSAAAAFEKILKTESKFVSRGDDSGTHKKEQAVWGALKKLSPEGKWYMESGQGMTATIMIADEKNAYCLTDRATYLSAKEKIRLGLLFEGGDILANPYIVMAVNPRKHPHAQYELAVKFIDWICSPASMKKIAGFKKNGILLFNPLLPVEDK